MLGRQIALLLVVELERMAVGIGEAVGRAVAEITADLASRKRATVDAAVVAAGRARIAGARSALRALGPDDARYVSFRRRLASQLY